MTVNAEQLERLIKVTSEDGMMRRGISYDYLDQIHEALKALKSCREILKEHKY